MWCGVEMLRTLRAKPGVLPFRVPRARRKIQRPSAQRKSSMPRQMNSNISGNIWGDEVMVSYIQEQTTVVGLVVTKTQSS